MGSSGGTLCWIVHCNVELPKGRANEIWSKDISHKRNKEQSIPILYGFKPPFWGFTLPHFQVPLGPVSAPGLAFVAFPIAISQMPGSFFFVPWPKLCISWEGKTGFHCITLMAVAKCTSQWTIGVWGNPFLLHDAQAAGWGYIRVFLAPMSFSTRSSR